MLASGKLQQPPKKAKREAEMIAQVAAQTKYETHISITSSSSALVSATVHRQQPSAVFMCR
jgi:hypothetical protein